MRSDVRFWSMLPLVLAMGFTPWRSAHHSTAEFDYTKQVTIKGTVKEVQWTNPHSYIQLLADGEGGRQDPVVGGDRLAEPEHQHGLAQEQRQGG